MSKIKKEEVVVNEDEQDEDPIDTEDSDIKGSKESLEDYEAEAYDEKFKIEPIKSTKLSFRSRIGELFNPLRKFKPGIVWKGKVYRKRFLDKFRKNDADKIKNPIISKAASEIKIRTVGHFVEIGKSISNWIDFANEVPKLMDRSKHLNCKMNEMLSGDEVNVDDEIETVKYRKMMNEAVYISDLVGDKKFHEKEFDIDESTDKLYNCINNLTNKVDKKYIVRTKNEEFGEETITNNKLIKDDELFGKGLVDDSYIKHLIYAIGFKRFDIRGGYDKEIIIKKITRDFKWLGLGDSEVLSLETIYKIKGYTHVWKEKELNPDDYNI